jgi:DNA-3-methyladenine glycosylase I
VDHGVKKTAELPPGFSPVRSGARGGDGDDDVERLLQDAGIIRHRGKIQAIIGNARAYLAMEENGESFTDFVWSFVDNAPQVTRARRWRRSHHDAGLRCAVEGIEKTRL